MATPINRWRARAACAGMGSDIFFSDSLTVIADAKRVCSTCTVRDECNDYAVTNREPCGVWGGLSTEQRTRPRTPGQRGPAPSINDDDLRHIFGDARRDTAALLTLQAARPFGAQTAYKYLRRARELGLIEIRGRTMYPRR